MSPCRLMDARTGSDRVGPHPTFGPAETKSVAVHGNNEKCWLPADAYALSMNVTMVGATQGTFVTIWPDGSRPLASSLNPFPGQPPTPNAVIVRVSGTGTMNMYNLAGSVDAIVDINGYFTRVSLQELNSGGGGGGGGGVADPTGFSAWITGYGPGFSITTVTGEVKNESNAIEDTNRVDVTCPGGELETDIVFDVPQGVTRGWQVLCEGVHNSGATVKTTLI